MLRGNCFKSQLGGYLLCNFSNDYLEVSVKVCIFADKYSKLKTIIMNKTGIYICVHMGMHST